jgi:hypothetical protein
MFRFIHTADIPPNRPDKIADLLNDVKALLAARLSRREDLP